MPIGMKKIIIGISILVYSNVGSSQTKNDVLDLKNINYKLLDSLVFDEAMKERGKIGRPPIKKDLICYTAAKYQSEYMSNFKVFDHKNMEKFKGILLEHSYDRYDFFSKKLKSNKEIVGTMEILVEIIDLNKKYKNLNTYEEYAKKVIEFYLSSPEHRMALLYDNEKYNVFGDFKTVYNDINKSLYVTGLYSCSIK